MNTSHKISGNNDMPTAGQKQTGESIHIFRAIADNAGDAIAISDLEGKMIYSNRAAYELLGFDYGKRELDGAPMDTFAPEQERARQAEAIGQIMATGGRLNTEAMAVRKDGSTVNIAVTMFPIIDEQNRPTNIGAILRNISERKQTEEVLAREQSFMRALMDSIPDKIYFKDLQSRFLQISKSQSDMFSLSDPSGAVGKSDFDFFTKEHAQLAYEDEQTIIRTGQPITKEERETWMDRPDTWALTTKLPLYDETGKVAGTFGVSKDITERKQVEEALREANARVQAVLDAATQEAIIATEPDGLIAIFNTGAERMLGYSAEEMVGKQSPAILHLESEGVARGKELSAEFGRPIEGFDVFVEYARQGRYEERNWTYVRKDGAYLTVSLAVTALRDSAGNITGFLGVARDITERRHLEQQIQTAFERRGYQVQISNEISQEIASASEVSDLFERVVTLTKERLGYYHTQLLRYDTTQDAVVLINGYGETGQKMLSGGHKMPLGAGLIGTAAASGQTVLRPTLADDPDWQPNPLLPDTKGEIAIPIKFGEQILGVLDVQSDQAGALTEDDRLLLEGLCGQIAVAVEQTRLRQEMAERLEEVNRLYQSMSHEGWKTYRETENLPAGFMFDQASIRPVDESVSTDEFFANIPMKVLGGEVVGTLAVADDPQHPTSAEDRAFFQQVSEQIALALESARLTAQTQSALAQTEKLYAASRAITATHDEMGAASELVKHIDHTNLDRVVVAMKISDDPVTAQVVAVWDRSGMEDRFLGNRFTDQQIPLISQMRWDEVMLVNDFNNAPHVDPATKETFNALGVKSAAIVPIAGSGNLMGWVLLETTRALTQFSAESTQLYFSLAGQAATVIQGQRLLAQSQKQAERENMLNVISQKIQGATTVEAVLQIAARELGHALGAPMTIAQLSMKDKR